MTVSARDVVWVEGPVPVIVIVAAPAGALELAVNVSIEDPEPVITDELKLAVTPVGNPEMLRVTALLNPFSPLTNTFGYAMRFGDSTTIDVGAVLT